MIYSIGIVGHVKREDAARQLAKQVDADHLSIDDGSLGANVHHRKVWEQLATQDTIWSVVLEDDALPVEGFSAQLSAALSEAPAPVVSLYLGKKRPPHRQQAIEQAVAEAKRTDAHWILSDHLFHHVAVAICTDRIHHMLTNLDTNLPIDEAISEWVNQCGYYCAYTNPSLVEHSDGPSLVIHRDGKPRPSGRVAHCLGTRDSWAVNQFVKM